MKRFFRPRNILVTLIIAGLIFGGSMVFAKKEIEVDGTKFNLSRTKTYSIKREDIRQNLVMAGNIDIEKFAKLQFQASGLLSWMGVKVGDPVKKGQAVASLDKVSLKKNLEKDLNDYLTNRWDFEDTQDTYKQTKEKYLVTDAIQRILDRAQFSLNNAVLDVEITNIALKYATLTTPIDGIVVQIDTPTAGVHITPANANILVIDPQSIIFKSEVSEEEVNLLHVGQIADIKLDAFPDETFKSQIYYISFLPKTGESSVIYEVKYQLPIDNKEQRVRHNMNGDAKIIIKESKNAITINNEAIYGDGVNKFVLLKTDLSDIPVKTPITTGIETEEKTEVLTGLKEGDHVIVTTQ